MSSAATDRHGMPKRRRAEALAATMPPLMVAAERVAATVAQGVHGRRRVGPGDSFWQFRPYQAGDSAHRIDWRQTAKGQSVFIREHEWDAAQTVWLWRDGSPSMEYGSVPGASKRDRAEILLLALASLLTRAGERVALVGGGDPPAAGRVSLSRIAMALGTGTNPVGLPPMLDLPRSAELVLFGDFLSRLEEMDRVVRFFAQRGVRGHLFQVLDPTEVQLPFSGRVRFFGLEAEGETLVPRVEGVRTAYLERLAQHQKGLAALARAAGWTYAIHATDRPPQTALLSLFNALGTSPHSSRRAGAR